MNRQELILAGLAPAKGLPHTPVQVQKLFFLIDENIGVVVGGPHFHFEPYDYGPFDKAVYLELESLAQEGFVDIVPTNSFRTYKLTVLGQIKGDALLATLPVDAQAYIKSVSQFVRKLSFTELVSAIYKAYPKMRVNSVFQG